MKNEIRKQMKMRRNALDDREVLTKSRNASKIFLESDIYKQSKNLMLYMPLGNEISTLEIIKDALEISKTVLVPVTDKKTFEITAHKISKDTHFTKGVFSLTEPTQKFVFDKEKIDTIVIPGIAFDKIGGRIGFGKGCYDSFLKNTSAIKVGFCYDFQLLGKIETDPHDIGMDYILTEKELINCKA